MKFSLLFQNDTVAFLPELFLAISILVILLHGSFLGLSAAALYTYLTPSMTRLTSIILFISVFLVVNNPIESQTLWNSIFITDHLSIWLKLFVVLGLLVCVSVSEAYMFSVRLRAFEFFFFIISICLSLCLLISSYDLLSIYLNMEFMSLIFYVLATWKKNSYFSAEAGLKYFILGSVASVFFLFGASLIYFSMGTTNLGSLSLLTENIAGCSPLFYLGLICLISALLFKLGSAPYHMWIADVYEGAPTIVSLIFASVPKLAIFVVVLRLVYTSFWCLFPVFWEDFFCLCGLFSLFIGCVCGLGETKIKRLLAFSSVGHVGFLCLGLASGSVEGIQSVLFYLLIYMLTALFLWIYALHLDLTSDNSFLTFSDVIGLVRSSPVYGLGIVLMIFSLAGVPPLGGFFAKLNIFVGVIDSSYYIVALLAVLTSAISAFYYLRLIKIFYFEKAENWFYFAPLTKGAASCVVIIGWIVIFFMLSPNLFYLLTYKIAIGLMI
uniref:NADH dehydrogenase subunit 2 n=1 Tax=Sargassum fusiforme TaxID=590727 RepID=A0A0U1WNN3_SARFS|nr:NADH dehydrogenase subunit 2 [Sargassum fusiforme]AIG23781.1 NADH dehydrogenase subunit 2 [Sargassum fusiforme]QJC59488.1 NADH dehydrogenase subunit 2 [Sargassum fusiforme]